MPHISIAVSLFTAAMLLLAPAAISFLRSFGQVRVVSVPVWSRSLRSISGYRAVE